MDFAFISIVVVLLVILLVDNRFQEEQVVTLPVQERDLDSERFMPKSLHRLGNYKDYTMDDSKWEMAVARPIGKRLDGKSENNDGKRMIVRPPPFDRNANAIIYPNRAYCYKIKLVEKQKKLFINICTHKLIPKFKPLSDFDLEKMVLNRSNLNLMICYSGVRQEKDKTGEDCFVLDVVISPTLLYEIWKKKILNSLFLETILRDIEENFNVELNRESIVKLVNTLYYGKFRPITLRTRYDVNESDVLRNNEKDDDDANEWRTFSNYIVSYDPEGKKKSLVVKIQVPEDQTPESFQVRVSHNLISVTNETKKTHIRIKQPFFNRKVTKHV